VDFNNFHSHGRGKRIWDRYENNLGEVSKTSDYDERETWEVYIPVDFIIRR